ncbi:MAG: hypothetical protein AAFV26_03030 [Pseudomonadota bacterium]
MTSIRQGLLVILACAQFIVPNLARFIDGLTPIGEATGQTPLPEQPAGYAFLIWFVIFALILVFAVRQVMPSQRDNPLYRSIGWLAVGAVAANVAWMSVAIAIGNGWHLVVLIWTIFVFAVATLLVLLARSSLWTGFDRWITQPAFALLTGWISAAVWLNVSSVMREAAGGVPFGVNGLTFSLGIIGAMTMTGIIVSWLSRWNSFYLGTLCWAFVGVFIKATTSDLNIEIAAAAATLAILTGGGALLSAASEARADPTSTVNSPGAQQ